MQRLFHTLLQTSFKPKVVSCITNRSYNLMSFALNLLPRQCQILQTQCKW